MSTFNLEEEATEYLPLLAGLAYQLARANPGIPVDDLISAGQYTLAEYVLPRFDPSKGTLPTFAYRPVKSAMLVCLRKWQRDANSLVEINDEEHACKYTESPYHHVARTDSVNWLRRALNRLSPRDQRLLLQGVATTQKEAVDAAGLNAHNASWHFNQALARLRRVLIPDRIPQ